MAHRSTLFLTQNHALETQFSKVFFLFFRGISKTTKWEELSKIFHHHPNSRAGRKNSTPTESLKNRGEDADNIFFSKMIIFFCRRFRTVRPQTMKGRYNFSLYTIGSIVGLTMAVKVKNMVIKK